ncbi:hypothetical protein F443_08153, partial [Phytophthora nicotianae P1569]
MRCMRWLLLAAVALAAVQAAPADERALMELEETLLASAQLQNGRRLLSVDLFEEHAARYLMAAADTTEEATALFKLYKKLYPERVAAWGSTEATQLAYFEENVFPSIQKKAKALLSSTSASGSGTNVGDESGTGTTSGTTRETDRSDSTTSGSSKTSSGTSTSGGTSTSSGTSGTSTNSGTSSTSGTSGTSTSGGTTHSGTSTSGGTTSS